MKTPLLSRGSQALRFASLLLRRYLSPIPFLALALGLAMGGTRPASACGKPQTALQTLADQAISPDTTQADAAIAALRAAGPAGLQALFTAHDVFIQSHLAREQPIDEQWTRIQHALDMVGAQRDCAASGLYWFTDFDAAKAAAKTSGKPILSLRLLGRLDEELSCANSRFFRTTLYANRQVSSYLKDHFVLHWKSVRPVPKVTIDFGDGRKLQRTITGNSIHYILDADGEVIDALPGLYGARAFLEGLELAVATERQCSTLPATERNQFLQGYHRTRLAAINTAWENDLRRIALPASTPLAAAAPSPESSSPPSAEKATRLTASKIAAEMPLLRGTRIKRAALPVETDDATWAALASLHAEQSQLDAGARSLIRAKHPGALEAGVRTRAKQQVEDPMLRTLRNLERSIAEDTVRNEYVFHAAIHQWLSAGQPDQIDQFNRRIYAELFLTPDSDPWLGLVTPGVFSALDCEGLVVTAR